MQLKQGDNAIKSQGVIESKSEWEDILEGTGTIILNMKQQINICSCSKDSN